MPGDEYSLVARHLSQDGTEEFQRRLQIEGLPVLDRLEIGVRHHVDEIDEGAARRPAERPARLAGVAKQEIDLRRAMVPRVDGDELGTSLGVDTDFVFTTSPEFEIESQS